MACHVGVLPSDILQLVSRRLESEESGCVTELRLLKLLHPRTGTLSLFLPYTSPNNAKSTILEVQSVSPPNRRSWFMQNEVQEDGKLLIMTPIDPIFLLIPLIHATQSVDGPGLFRPFDEVFEDALSKMKSSAKGDEEEGRRITLTDDMSILASLSCVHAAMGRICDHKDIGHDILVYRYSAERTLEYLRSKVSRLSQQSVSELSSTLTRQFARDGLLEDGKDELLEAARKKAACELLSHYLPREVYDQLVASYDFSGLDEYVKGIKAETMALASANMNTVEARESRGSVNKVMDEDKKRKAPKTSAGVEKLKKVNIKGMAKLSTFFQKK
ncbi:ribonuclease H2, subunit B [Epithele typhae]|uniref:ribonuclease H2, subunit B n=1 Tax=Epithele typhae TaxID=378194 RepID=UPI002007A779|nr:ribonuclease H2, subunit B [Epithele typhae]KAH9931096.1 ribonuclease H2, subunit B [Epithele typhae]